MNEPIQTIYNGYKFRSRLEARWAVFFDNAKIRYRYEQEGYTHNGICYLPDFYLPDFDIHVEVKGCENSDYLSNEIQKISNFIYWGGEIKAVVFLASIPDICQGSKLYFPCILYSPRGIKDKERMISWWCFYDGENGKCEGHITFEDINPPFSFKNDKFVGRYIGNNSYGKLSLDAVPYHVLKKEQHNKSYDDMHMFYAFLEDTLKTYEKDYLHELRIQAEKNTNPIFWHALDKARQARFENGEKG